MHFGCVEFPVNNSRRHIKGTFLDMLTSPIGVDLVQIVMYLSAVAHFSILQVCNNNCNFYAEANFKRHQSGEHKTVRHNFRHNVDYLQISVFVRTVAGPNPLFLFYLHAKLHFITTRFDVTHVFSSICRIFNFL